MPAIHLLPMPRDLRHTSQAIQVCRSAMTLRRTSPVRLTRTQERDLQTLTSDLCNLLLTARELSLSHGSRNFTESSNHYFTHLTQSVGITSGSSIIKSSAPQVTARALPARGPASAITFSIMSRKTISIPSLSTSMRLTSARMMSR